MFLTTENEGNKALTKESIVYRNLAKDRRDVMVSIGKDSYRNSRQTIMCSATIPQRYDYSDTNILCNMSFCHDRQHFASSCWKNGWTETLPELLHVSADELIPTQIEHEYITCEKELRIPCVSYLLRVEQKKMFSATGSEHFRAIVFVDDERSISLIGKSVEKENDKLKRTASDSGNNSGSNSDSAITESSTRKSMKDKILKRKSEIKEDVFNKGKLISSSLYADMSLDDRAKSLEDFRYR